MQDRYVGDIGDFAKYGLLRAINEGRNLGVAWYLHPPDPGRPGDGRHTQYLRRPDKWRHLDCQLFDDLRKIVDREQRSIAAVQESGILGDAIFADEPLDMKNVPVRCRTNWRRTWFERVKETLADCDLVFADPDNGIVPEEKFSPTRKRSTKSISVGEARDIAKGRTAVIYHHNTRRKGGHRKEIRHWMSELPGCTRAWYWRRWSNRTFFIVNPDNRMESQLKEFAERWKKCGKLLPQ
ncbi:MAG: hypothetical protein OXD42_14660 [Rhodospirillaceae bacterium]|nr:hypothetical protein [Rhodospirillaceae bacterium]